MIELKRYLQFQFQEEAFEHRRRNTKKNTIQQNTLHIFNTHISKKQMEELRNR